MGIRLSFRNKYKPDAEYCLGKYLSYAETTDAHESIDFLVECGALDDYEWWDDPDHILSKSEVVDRFITECQSCTYQDYGSLFELSTEDLIWFIYLNIIDKSKLREWPVSDFKDQFVGAMEFIKDNAAVENRWEFRLGA